MLQLKKPAYSWWWESHNSPRQSGWLQSTLSELDAKTKTMLKLIEEDADSFAKRAEMYYKKRPELVNMVEDFYRSYRSLAEHYDQMKSETGSRVVAPLGWLYASKTSSNTDKSSEQCESFDLEDSDVEDPESDEDTQIPYHSKNNQNDLTERREFDKVSGFDGESENCMEVMRLREKVIRLEEENRNQKTELVEMSENKREVIRQLCMSIEMMKEENALMRRCMKDSTKWNFFDRSKWNFGNLLGRSFALHPNLVAL